jgi:peroxiredoxin
MASTSDTPGAALTAARRRPLSLLLAAAVLAAIVALLFYADGGGALPLVGRVKPKSDAPDTRDFAGPQGAAAVGQPAPGFSLPGLDSRPVNLSDFEGRTVVLNFWATWCGPCREELPELQSVADRFQAQGVTVLGVNVQEGAAVVQRFLRDLGVRFPVVRDSDGNVALRYRVSGLPVTFIVGPDGVLRDRLTGQVTAGLVSERLAALGLATDGQP